MNLDEFVTLLNRNPQVAVSLMLPDGTFVPVHYHVTEVGRVQKDFIDCGGTRRSTETCVLQVWVAGDTDHRLDTSKLAKIVQIGMPLFPSPTIPVEFEYERGVVSQYPIERAEATVFGLLIRLGSKRTACLAPDRCGVEATDAGCCSSPGCS